MSTKLGMLPRTSSKVCIFTAALLRSWGAHGNSARHRSIMVEYTVSSTVAVGTTIAGRPPHRSVRAELPHTAPTLDVLRQNVCRDKDAEFGAEESTFRRSVAAGPIPVSASDCVGAIPAATAYTDGPGIFPTPRCYPALRGSGNTLVRPVSATHRRPRPAHASSCASPASIAEVSPSSASPPSVATLRMTLWSYSHNNG